MPLGLTGVFVTDEGRIETRPFYVPLSYYEQIQDETPWIWEDLALLNCLINVEPEGVIFKDLKRDGHETAFCYSCRPTMAVQPGVFVGFVDQPPSHGFMGPVLFWFEWRDEEPDRPCYPIGHADDFGGEVWKRP